ncbi:AAA family ATPase [Actinoalloteichus spitiensis]|uniref:AAA family ATPase n=1 Tax=Actinoalloteichus spitiensis TaxID=252394 RepID=UPI000366E60B|nr:ATP-binding protein [Actinoalloteichus spitiensis]
MSTDHPTAQPTRPATTVLSGQRHWQDQAAGTHLLDRASQLATLRGIVSQLLAATPSVGVVEGPPGSGRSALLLHACAAAERRGARVVLARGTPAETGLRHGITSQLLGALTPPGSSLWTSPVWTDPDRDAELVPLLCRDFLSVARQQPLLVVVDDAHWADRWSVGWLGALRRRLRDVPLALLLAGDTGAVPLSPRTDGAPHGRDRVTAPHLLAVGPLTADSVRTALGRAGAPVPEDLARAAADATGGSPWLLDVLRRHLATVGVPPGELRPTDVWRVVAAAHGDRVTRLAATLDAEPVGLLRALAATEGRLPFRLVAALAGLRDASDRVVLDRLTGMGLVRGRGGPGDRPDVLGPIVRDRVLAEMTTGARDDLYARAADLAHRSAVDDVDVAELLMRAPPGGGHWAVGVLRRAAHQARAAGHPEDAARYLDRALREPLAPTTRMHTLIERAAVSATADGGERYLAEVLTDASGGRALADATLRAADLLLAGGRGRTAYWQLSALADAHRAAGAPEEIHAPFTALCQLAHATQRGEPGGLVELAPPALPADPRDPAQCAATAHSLAVTGVDLPRTVDLARRALATSAPPTAALTAPRLAAARALSLAGRDEEALDALDTVLAEARRQAPPWVVARVLTVRAGTALRAALPAEVDRTLALISDALPAVRRSRSLAAQVASVRALHHLDVGDVADAARALRTCPPDVTIGGEIGARVLYTRGRLSLALGEPGKALTDLRQCGWRLLARQEPNPALLPWRGYTATACLATGDVTEATRLFDEERELAAAWGAPAPLRHTEELAARAWSTAPSPRHRDLAAPSGSPGRRPGEPGREDAR